MKRRFGKIKRDQDGTYLVEVKQAADFRRWPYRENYDRHATLPEARAAAERAGLLLVKRWCDAKLTPDEAKASGY